MIAVNVNSRQLSPRITLLALLLLALGGGCASQAPQVEKRSYAFWPAYPDEPRVLFLASYARNSDLEPPSSSLDQMLYGNDADKGAMLIDHPYGVAMWNGRVYVCDTHNSAVEILDLRKKQMFLMRAEDSNPMVNPVAVVVADDGFKYVADNIGNTISVFDANDVYVRRFGHKNFSPVGLAVFGNRLYATDFKAGHVEIFDRNTGQSLGLIGQKGTGTGSKDGMLVGPLGVAVDLQGNVYVDELYNDRVQKFSPDGKFLGKFGQAGDSAGTFTRPKHLAVDGDGVLYVVDAAFYNVQMFNQQFQPLMYFGGPGTSPGSMDMPVGITVHDGDLDIFQDRIPAAFEAQRLLVVTNQYGMRRVSIYALGHLRPGHSVEELHASSKVVQEYSTTRPTTGPGAPLPPGVGTMPPSH